MTLDIIVPHYKEPWEICKYLFDSIAMQRGVSLNNIRVLVVNDGDCLIDIPDYPYKIDYLVKPHGGISDTRNYGLDHSTADYVMFCDIDDGFLSNYGLHTVFSAMQEGFDYLTSTFIEETFSAENTMTIVAHKNDLTFIHGKVYRRQFLLDRDLRFDPAMTIHEDGYFNMLVYIECEHHGVRKNIEAPFYLWRWNDASVVRKDRKDFTLKTYEHVIQTRIGLCEQLKARGYEKEFRTSVAMTVLNTYYDFQKDSYRAPANAKYLRKAENAFREYIRRYGKVFNDITNGEIADIAATARQNARKNGFLFEKETLKDFTKRFAQ